MKSAIIGISLILAVLTATLANESPSTRLTSIDAKVASTSEEEIIIEKAKKLFKEKQLAGISMVNGPCLSEEIVPGWCVDVVHLPRFEDDKDPENQCKFYNEGKTKHCIELDQEGNLIRIL